MVTVVYDFELSKNFSLRLGRRFSFREEIIASSLYYIWKKKRTIRAARYLLLLFFFSKIAECSADNRLRGENYTPSVGNIQVSQSLWQALFG